VEKWEFIRLLHLPGIASGAALVLIIASGAAMASHFDRWSGVDPAH
jgi:hypothetical protein